VSFLPSGTRDRIVVTQTEIDRLRAINADLLSALTAMRAAYGDVVINDTRRASLADAADEMADAAIAEAERVLQA